MLDTFIHYNDLCLEIEVIKEQIKLTGSELEYWFGVKINGTEGDGIPLGSWGSFKYGANTSLDQAQSKINSINKLRERLEKLEQSKEKIDKLLTNFKGLEYKIAYHKYVEGRTLKETAEELGYSYDYVREVMSRMRNAI